MATDSNPRVRMVRFATFEVDLSARELRKGGVKIKVYGQPFEVLAMLLERPGEIVTREELKQKLWPTDTFVDFDHGVNTAIKRLREALGDSAENPRFVETVPRRGYRFIAPVDAAAAASESSPSVRDNAEAESFPETPINRRKRSHSPSSSELPWLRCSASSPCGNTSLRDAVDLPFNPLPFCRW